MELSLLHRQPGWKGSSPTDQVNPGKELPILLIHLAQHWSRDGAEKEQQENYKAAGWISQARCLLVPHQMPFCVVRQML